MKLKVNDAGLPIQLSPVHKPASAVGSSPISLPSPPPESDLNKGIVFLWSSLTLFLNTALILVAIALTLCDIIDLEKDSKVKLLYLPDQIQLSLIDWAPRFLVTVIGFMLSVVILVLERNANYQPWDAVISLLWFTSQISHLPETSHYFRLSELFIFKCILSATLASLSLILLISHSITCFRLYYHRDSHKPRDVRSINPSHKELVQSFKENNETCSSPPSKNSSPGPSRQKTSIYTEQKSVSPSTSPISPYRNLTIKPDLALRKRLAGLSIDKEIKIKHCTIEDEPFDKLLEKLGTNLQSTRKTMSFQGVTPQTNWITSGFWSTRCYGNEMGLKEGENVQTGMFASFSASWSRFISDGSETSIISSVTQKMVRISNQATQNKSKCESIDSLERIDQKAVVQPSKLNILPQLTYK